MPLAFQGDVERERCLPFNQSGASLRFDLSSGEQDDVLVGRRNSVLRCYEVMRGTLDSLDLTYIRRYMFLGRLKGDTFTDIVACRFGNLRC